MQRIKLKVLGLSYSQAQSGAYALLLAEEKGERKIPIIIGSMEAQAIAVQLENLKPPRPLTHDLFKSFADAFAVRVIEVSIYRLTEGIFYSELVCETGNNRVRIDARTSDAIAIALRFNCPIYVTKTIMDKTGIELTLEKDILKEEEGKTASFSKRKKGVKDLKEYTLEQLETLLQQSITREDYEKASKIRDEISKRKKP